MDKNELQESEIAGRIAAVVAARHNYSQAEGSAGMALSSVDQVCSLHNCCMIAAHCCMSGQSHKEDSALDLKVRRGRL